jgi:ribonuclease BN (tRNA processing enzyme)
MGVGVVRRWAGALRDGVADLDPASLGTAFVTHLHSDHTLGYPELIFTTWTLGGPPLHVYGPAGLKAMTVHILAAYAADVAMRTGEAADASGRSGPQVQVDEIVPGVVYRDSFVTVTAFRVQHGTVPEAFGYRVQTPDRVIVLSGDAGPPSVVAQQCQGCDLLLHEGGFFAEADARDYYRRFHTTAEALAKIARDAHPKLLVLYHQRSGAFTEHGYAVLRSLYSGPFVVARDLDVFR